MVGECGNGLYYFEVKSDSPEATRTIGEKVGRFLAAGDVVALYGDLGAGKTCFAQGVARGLGILGQVTSPTFVLLREYEGRLPLYHFDAYRLSGPEDFAELGSEEYFSGPGVSIIEWAERVTDILPEDRLEVELLRLHGEENTRLIHFKGTGERSLAIVEVLKRVLRFGN
ncbi:MAG: tRNA (adenosine(37)-N6)-threonylcarbamoyltransferase complex ATPase subunit type 1 TsaE [Bacillota bacterium]